MTSSTLLTGRSIVRRIVGWTQFVMGQRRQPFSHVPVMADEVLKLLRPENGKVFIDMTFGGGGHTRKLLDTHKSIKVVAVDRDPVAYKRAQELAAEIENKSKRFNLNQSVIPIHGQFSTVMKKIHLSGIPYGSVNGILFDLGASSLQYDDPKRGFALSLDGPLDMRMDTTNESSITAEDVVNSLSMEDLALIFKLYGEERRSRKIANAIIDARTLLGRIQRTQELSKIIEGCKPHKLDSLGRFSHSGTKVFQALRIFVNNELNELNYALEKMREFLIPAKIVRTEDNEEAITDPYGIVVALTFHSLEDRIVKRHFSSIDINEPTFKYLSQHDRIRTSLPEVVEQPEQMETKKNWRVVLKHVDKPSELEQEANPRSRSAKLRAAVRIS